MAFCYHLGRIYFRIASRPFSVASVFKTEKNWGRSNRQYSQYSTNFKYFHEFIPLHFHPISIRLVPEFQFLFLSNGACKSKGTLDKVVWDRFYALKKNF